MFQFPSNGKVYSEAGVIRQYEDAKSFQFPSNGKVYSEKEMKMTKRDVIAGFQFPSNGKVYSEKSVKVETQQRKGGSFNSLQTGKCIQSADPAAREKMGKVSIPFKRESVFRALASGVPYIRYLRFQFPSNGKVYSENFLMNKVMLMGNLFQFPSNGKVYSE